MNISITTSNKGGKKLFVDGYCYHLSRKTEKTYNWVCSKQKSQLCKGRVVTRVEGEEHEIVKCTSNHSHEPIAHEKIVAQANADVKQCARNTETIPSHILRESIINTPSHSRVYLPTKMAQKIKIQRVRANKPKEPETLENIIIPENLRYIEGELFILNEDYFDGDKIILMGTISSLKLLGESSCWIMDGTFDVVPSIMRQLFSIHGRIEGKIVPLIFCLMSKKSKKVYDQLFFNLRKICLEYEISVNPERIICDFEKTIVSSAKVFFPNASFKGCLFHFGQIIWRKIQKEGLVAKYGNEENFSIQIRMIKSIAFVPPNEVDNYYQSLSRKFNDEDVKNIGVWFKKNYIGEGSQRPRYKPEFWAIGDNDNGSETFPRTQNSVEAWHRRLKVIVGKRHAGIYKILEDLGKESILAKAQVEKVQCGENIPKNKKLIKKNKNIKRIIMKRLKIKKTDFLQRIAHNILLG